MVLNLCFFIFRSPRYKWNNLYWWVNYNCSTHHRRSSSFRLRTHIRYPKSSPRFLVCHFGGIGFHCNTVGISDRINRSAKTLLHKQIPFWEFLYIHMHYEALVSVSGYNGKPGLGSGLGLWSGILTWTVDFKLSTRIGLSIFSIYNFENEYLHITIGYDSISISLRKKTQKVNFVK